MPAGYAPLPTQQPTPEADRELHETFALHSDEEDPHDSSLGQITRTPSRWPPHPETTPKASSAIPPVYDFERNFDYARPPPGSPPRLTAVALPNDFGNSNGFLPSSPIELPNHRPSLFRRAIGAILPSHYLRLPTSEVLPLSRVIGGGTQNDGVFANVTAKPSRSVQRRSNNGNVYVMPEETQSTAPPSYDVAQADAVPPYWETTVHAPAGLDTDSGMIIDDLPTGSICAFMIYAFTSYFFQFVGFIVTYLLHTTHAAKFGSRAGLGLTLIQYGFYSRVGEDGFRGPTALPVDSTLGTDKIADRSFLSAVTSTSSENSSSDVAFLSITSKEWLSFLLMTLGWFILLSSLIGFWRVKHWEASIRATQARGPPSAEEIERDIATRRALETALNLPDSESAQNEVHIPSELELEDARLQRDLFAAALL